MESKSIGDRVVIVEQQMEALRELPDRVERVGGRLASVEGRLVSVEGRLVAVEGRLGEVESRLGAVEGQIVQLRTGMTAEFSSVRKELRMEIKAGDEETRRLMRVLHEEVIARIAMLGEGRG